jgi:arsenite methyltransferase
MKKTEEQETVSKVYAEALRKAEGSGCGCGCDSRADLAAETAGYEDTKGVTSFGCGNPLAFSDVTEGQTVVDLGSGAGLDLLIAAEKVGPSGSVIGIDMTDEMIAKARRNAQDAGATQIEVRKGLIEELPVEDERADWIISNCVINLSADKPAVFREVARVLKPGGRFRITDLVAEDLPEWLSSESAAHVACIAGAISEAEYVSGLESAGLTDVSLEETITFTADQLEAMVTRDMVNLGLDPKSLEGRFQEIEGKVKSIQISGRKADGDDCCGGPSDEIAEAIAASASSGCCCS